MNDALSATYDGNVGAAKAQHVQAKRDRLVARCAGRHGCVHPGSGTQPKTDVGCRGVGHQHRDSQWADSACAFLFLDVPVGKQGDHSADACGNGNAKTLTVDGIVLPQPVPSVLPGLHSGDNCQLGRAVEPAGLNPLQDLGGIDGRLCRDLHRKLIGPVGFDLVYAGFTG